VSHAPPVGGDDSAASKRHLKKGTPISTNPVVYLYSMSDANIKTMISEIDKMCEAAKQTMLLDSKKVKKYLSRISEEQVS